MPLPSSSGKYLIVPCRASLKAEHRAAAAKEAGIEPQSQSDDPGRRDTDTGVFSQS